MADREQTRLHIHIDAATGELLHTIPTWACRTV
jgi:hypothetical protein